MLMKSFLQQALGRCVQWVAVLGLVAAVGLAGTENANAQTAAPADEFIKSISTDAIDKISKDKEIQAGDIKRLSDLVDTTIMPNVNFERMTALAVGRGWRQATPEQQKRLMTEFRILLLRTYSGALSAVKDQSVRMKPFRADAAETDVVVRTEIVPKRGDPIQLDYRVEKAGANWKIYDLNVLGVWLVETYRNQFAQEVSNKGIDGLIQSLSEKNKSFGSEKKG